MPEPIKPNDDEYGRMEDETPDDMSDSYDDPENHEEADKDIDVVEDDSAAFDYDGKDGYDEDEKPKEDPKPSGDDTSADKDKDKGSFDDDLLKRAHDAGLSDEDISVFTKPEQLERVLSLAKVEKATEETTPSTPIEENLLDELIGNREEWDDDTLAVLDKAKEAYKGVVAEVAALRTRISETENARYAEEIEAAISDMGEGGQSLFGKGTLDSLDPQSTECQNRMKLVQGMLVAAAVARSIGRKVPPTKELMNQAFAGTFPEEAKKLTTKDTRKALAAKAKERASLAVVDTESRDAADKRSPRERNLEHIRNVIGTHEEDEDEY